MAFRIKNISRQLLIITPNSGKPVHLAPQEVSEPMDEIEIRGNPKLEKMKKNSLIAVVDEKERGAEKQKKAEEKKKDENKE